MNIDLSSFVFYFLATLIIVFSASVVLVANPIYSALSLAVTMVTLGFLYFNLEAYFIAGVQLIVYAGAVIVLFVMVLMLFDLKKETEAFSGGTVSVFLKLMAGVVITAAISVAFKTSVQPMLESAGRQSPMDQMASVKLLATKLFTQYVFAFETLGVLLLVVAVGVVAVSRARGGTHADD